MSAPPPQPPERSLPDSNRGSADPGGDRPATEPPRAGARCADEPERHAAVWRTAMRASAVQLVVEPRQATNSNATVAGLVQPQLPRGKGPPPPSWLRPELDAYVLTYLIDAIRTRIGNRDSSTPRDFYLSVAAASLLDTTFVRTAHDLLAEQPDVASRLLLALGGPDRDSDGDAVRTSVLDLHERLPTLRFVIDAFGTGRCSLAHLRLLPVSGIVLDEDLLDDLGSGDSRRRRTAGAIVGRVVQLAHDLGLHVTATGLASPGLVAAARMFGVDLLAGPQIAPPQPLSEFLG